MAAHIAEKDEAARCWSHAAHYRIIGHDAPLPTPRIGVDGVTHPAQLPSNPAFPMNGMD